MNIPNSDIIIIAHVPVCPLVVVVVLIITGIGVVVVVGAVVVVVNASVAGKVTTVEM